MPEYAEYPKLLYHPNAQPAVVSDDLLWTGQGLPPIGWSSRPGQAASYPPVKVMNADQEAYHVSRGYSPGSVGDLQAWEKRVVAPRPPGFVQREYPYMDENGRIVEDPNKPAPHDLNYPKWVTLPDGTQAIAKNAAEERLMCPPPAPTGVEAECLAAIMAAADGDAASGWGDLPGSVIEPSSLSILANTLNNDQMDDLFGQAVALGIKIDRRWKRATLQAEIDKALAA